jgi:RNA polymerase sigma-70 factor (ECF subfamily)
MDPIAIIAADSPEDSFARAYDAYADAIFRHCAFRVFNRERGKELMQDAFMKTWEYIAKGNDIDNAQAFLYRTANNLVIDEIRRRIKRPEDSLDAMTEQGFEVGDGALDAEAMKVAVDARSVFETLEQVEEPYRSALVMRYVDDLSPAEIAEVTGESPNTISVRIHRATEKLKSLVKR